MKCHGDLGERIDRLEYLKRRGVSTWADERELAQLKREQAERDYDASKRTMDICEERFGGSK